MVRAVILGFNPHFALVGELSHQVARNLVIPIFRKEAPVTFVGMEVGLYLEDRCRCREAYVGFDPD